MRALADNAPRTESTTRKPASYRPSSNAAYSIANPDSTARPISTARRLGACGLTTNLPNDSAILDSAAAPARVGDITRSGAYKNRPRA
jgi:hypothetical protein